MEPQKSPIIALFFDQIFPLITSNGQLLLQMASYYIALLNVGSMFVTLTKEKVRMLNIFNTKA